MRCFIQDRERRRERERERKFVPPACILASRFLTDSNVPRLSYAISPNIMRRRKRQQYNARRHRLRKTTKRSRKLRLGARHKSRHDIGHELLIRTFQGHGNSMDIFISPQKLHIVPFHSHLGKTRNLSRICRVSNLLYQIIWTHIRNHLNVRIVKHINFGSRKFGFYRM